MKLRNIFTTLALAAFALVGCQKEEQRFLDEVQVSQSMVSLDVEGGSASITVTAAAAWEFAETDFWPNIIKRDKEGNIVSSEPSWLTIDKVSGGAGETVVTFSAEATTETREVLLYIDCGEVSQLVNIVQMAEKVEAPLTSCADVLAEATVGKVYKVKGTVTDTYNYEKYGCFYVNDGTAEVYVYGSMNSAQFAPEVGDIITFEGPWTSYGNFDDVTILSLEKSLIKVEKALPEEPLSLDGGSMTVLLTVKGEGLTVEIPEDAQAWLTAGEPADLAGLTSVELTAAANEGGARSTTVTFKTVAAGVDYIATVTVEQLGAIAEVSVADFLAAAEGSSLYKLTGVVKNLASTTYGNFDLVDATGSVYVYGLTATQVSSNDKSFESLGIKEGDIVTIIGTRASHKETPQVGGPAYYVSHVGHTESTVADFLAKETGDAWYKLTGTISNLVNEEYGNFDLVDETGSVYVYGLTAAPVAKNDKSFASLGLKEGDIVTLIGTRAEYKGAAQVGGPAYYISHEEGAPAVDPWETAAVVVNGAEATDDARLKELRAYADTDYLYVRLTATKETPFGADYLDFFFTDGEGETEVWWGWTTTGTDIYYQEHKCELDENGNLTKMRWYPVEGDRVYIDDYTTESSDSEVVWTMKFPRSYVDVYKSSTDTVHMSFLLWNGWDGYWAIPARNSAMLEVTLP